MSAEISQAVLSDNLELAVVVSQDEGILAMAERIAVVARSDLRRDIWRDLHSGNGKDHVAAAAVNFDGREGSGERPTADFGLGPRYRDAPQNASFAGWRVVRSRSGGDPFRTATIGQDAVVDDRDGLLHFDRGHRKPLRTFVQPIQFSFERSEI